VIDQRHGADRIASCLVSTPRPNIGRPQGTLTGTDPDVGIEPTGASLCYEMSAFLHLVDGKLRKIHQTVDLHDMTDQHGLSAS
jgi:hypothetical protein